MDDDVVDAAVLFEVGQHLLQLRTIGRSGGLTTFGELLADDGPDTHRLALVGCPLGRERKALLTAATLGLLTGGDTQVGHGAPGSQLLGQLLGRVLDGGRGGGSAPCCSIIR